MWIWGRGRLTGCATSNTCANAGTTNHRQRPKEDMAKCLSRTFLRPGHPSFCRLQAISAHIWHKDCQCSLHFKCSAMHLKCSEHWQSLCHMKIDHSNS
jgi:hypothetical protein